MISYYGYTISPNQLETDEGFLICRNVPIARIGDQEYLGTELGLDSRDVVTVHRPEEEVFSDATIASFEGKPVTDDHPSELLDADTAKLYSKGHAQNVRRGKGEWADYLLADLHIQDADLINAIKGGKREVSCGYMTEYEPNDDGTFTQRKIRGNHIAIVTEGRAGHEAAIMDSNTITAERPERKKMSKKSIWASLFGTAAEGKTAEEIARLALDTADAMSEDAAPEEEKPEGEKPGEDAKSEEDCGATDCGAVDEDYSKKLFESIDAMRGMIDRLMDALIPKEEEPAPADPIEQAIAALEEIKDSAETDEAPAEQEEAAVVPAENMDSNDAAMDAGLRKHLLTSMREAIAGIADEAARKKVTDALLNAVGAKKNDVSAVADAMQKKAAEAQAKVSINDMDEVQRRYDALNPHKKERN